jgi:hypothetical protein
MQTQKNLKREYLFQRELQKQKDRAEIANQFVRGCMLLNGGGALALLAFIQAIVQANKFRHLAPWAATGILIFVIGLAAASYANFLRVRVSLNDNKPDNWCRKMTRWSSRILQLVSPLLFLVGCTTFAIAIFEQFGLPKF